MTFKRTIVIAIIFLIIGGFYYFYEVKGKPGEKPAPGEEKKKVFKLKQDEIDKISITRKVKIEVPDMPEIPVMETGEKDNFVFVKKGSGWRMKKPIDTQADSDTIQEITKALTGLEIDETVDSKPGDLKSYGLDDPDYEISISKGDAHETLFLGDETIDNRFFLAKRKNSNGVFRVSTGFKYNLDRQMTDYRDKKIFSQKPEDIVKIILHTPEHHFIFEKDPEDKNEDTAWHMIKPNLKRYGSNEILIFVRTIAGLQTKEFYKDTPENRKKYGLNKDNFWMEVYPLNNPDRPTILYLGNSDENTKIQYARVRGAEDLYGLYLVERQKLDKKPIDFMSRMLLKTEMDKVAHLEVTVNDAQYVFEKESAGKLNKEGQPVYNWKIVKPGEKKDVNAEEMDRILENFANSYVNDAEFENPENKKYGFDKPIMKVRGQRYDTKELFDVTFGKTVKKEDTEFIYANVKGESTVVLLTNEGIKGWKDRVLKLIGKDKPKEPGPTAMPSMAPGKKKEGTDKGGKVEDTSKHS